MTSLKIKLISCEKNAVMVNSVLCSVSPLKKFFSHQKYLNVGPTLGQHHRVLDENLKSVAFILLALLRRTNVGPT